MACTPRDVGELQPELGREKRNDKTSEKQSNFSQSIMGKSRNLSGEKRLLCHFANQCHGIRNS